MTEYPFYNQFHQLCKEHFQGSIDLIGSWNIEEGRAYATVKGNTSILALDFDGVQIWECKDTLSGVLGWGGSLDKAIADFEQKHQNKTTI